jgi:hypothetical protein
MVLEEQARKAGQCVTEYVESLIAAQVRRTSLRELFAHVREDISIDDESLQSEIDAALADSRKTGFKQ